MRTCPDCRGIRRPCGTCMGYRIVPGEPADAAEAGRVAITELMLKPPRNPHPPGSAAHAQRELGLALEDLRAALAGCLAKLLNR